MSRWPALIHLTGPPASGKRTVAAALVEEAERRGHRAVLVDNHLVSRPILAAIGSDGVGLLPAEVWPHVHAIHREVIATIEELAPPDISFVFTNYLLEGKGRGMQAVESLRGLAARRASTFLSVSLHCDIDELLGRVPNDDRRAHLKWIDPDAVRAQLESERLLVPDGALVVDTTSRLPVESAALILDALD